MSIYINTLTLNWLILLISDSSLVNISIVDFDFLNFDRTQPIFTVLNISESQNYQWVGATLCAIEQNDQSNWTVTGTVVDVTI